MRQPGLLFKHEWNYWHTAVWKHRWAIDASLNLAKSIKPLAAFVESSRTLVLSPTETSLRFFSKLRSAMSSAIKAKMGTTGLKYMMRGRIV